jgi:periplasmic copper chaperone A
VMATPTTRINTTIKGCAMASRSLRHRRRFGARSATVLVAEITCLGTMATGGVAGASSTGSITVSKPWARTSPTEATNGAVYMVIKNTGSKDNALVGVSVPESVAMEAQIHETSEGAGGTMQMSEVSEITLGAKSTTRLEPGGYHLMLMQLATPLKTGSKIKVTLEFESGPKQTVQAVVKQ